MSRKQRRKAGFASSRQLADAPQPTPSRSSAGLRISPAALDGWRVNDHAPAPVPLTVDEIRRRYGPPATLGAPEDVRMACDNQLEACGVYSLLQHSYAMGQMPQAQFMGYSTLQQIAQNGLLRACIETVADDMTRNWIELKREGEAEKTARQRYLEAMGLADEEAEKDAEQQLAELADAMTRLNLPSVFHDACALVGYMGGALVFIDTGTHDPDTLKQPLNTSRASAEVVQGGRLRFVPIDPINVFPGLYNSTSPLREDYFKPRTWWVLGQEVHHTRLIRLVANEVPVLLKPAYNFLGIAQAQILWDYIMHFQNCRVDSQELLHKFSTTVLKTQMSDIFLQAAGTEQLDRRVMYWVQHRSNNGVQVIDKENEDILKLETPLSGVTDIVRQALEILAALNRTPAVKLLGISPSGFNATGESDIRNYYDHILSQQEKVLRPALSRVVELMQLHLWGRVDKSITFDFAALSEADKAAQANTQKITADTMAVLLDRNIVSPEECRQRLAADPDSGFANIDADEMPEPQEGQGGEGELGPESMAGFAGGEVNGPERPAMSGAQGARIDDVDKAGAVYGGEE